MTASERTAEFCVVGVGASAGGLDALRTLFSRMPAAPGFACVVVVHLSPEHESHLVELLQPYTQMRVRQVLATTLLEPNHVYVIPPNANLNTIDTHLRLSALETRRAQRAPIDHFLRTLATTHGETAVGVILTGAGSDGSLGLRQIREQGGLAIAQDPREAEHASMPQSAIASGTVDRVLALRDMADEIMRYCATRPRIAAGDGAKLDAAHAALLEKILGELRLRSGQEFAVYRPAVLLQRVRHRMRLRHVQELAEYFEILRDQAEEPRALYDDLLLSPSEFFGQADDYEALERLLSDLLDRKEECNTPVRIWTIGCSTGEQAYSLAMLLMELAARRNQEPRLQVFASELAPNALQQARDGVYPQEIAAAMSPARLQRFFVHEQGRYRVRRELRDLVTFTAHDLFKDPPFSHLDLIVCRNLLQRLRPEVRRGVLGLFYYALEPHGLLRVDRGDVVDTPGLLIPYDADPQLWRRASGPRHRVDLPPDLRPFARLSGERGGAPVASAGNDPAAVFRHAIERHMPPSVLIDAENQVVHFSTTASRYVRIPGGELTLDILKLVPGALAQRLGEGLRQARHGLRSWQSERFPALIEGRARPLIIRIDRTDGYNKAAALLLVVFDDSVEPYTAADEGVGGESVQPLRRLQDELARAHEQIASLAAQAAAPAARSGALQRQADEQLGGVMQELGEARKELSAVNEELLSLNEENQYRIETLAQVSNDLQHLLESTGLATLLVDRALNVVRFTPLVAELFCIRDDDVGRPLADIRNRLRYQGLLADVRAVIERGSAEQLELESEARNWFLVRIQPYRSALRGLEGALLVFIDITARKRAELALVEADRRKDEFLAVLAHELRNPLAPIGAGIEVLRRAPEKTAVVRQVTVTMARQTQQLVRLVDDLLEVSRISGGKLTLRVQPVGVAEIVNDAVTAVEPLMQTLEHRLSVTVPEEELVVEGDATRLTQVIANLLHNAARYTPPHGEIALQVRRSDDAVLISVRDNGLGIASQALPNVFEMFYQGNSAATLTNNGLGIGLTLAKRLVEMHAGTITAESAGPNSGSTFTVRLPLSRHALQGGGEGTRAAGGPGVERQRVLIVDDNHDAAETLRLLMATMGGSEVRTAASGPEALKLGAQMCPDVVLLDLGMPGMDGYEVARRMRGEPWGKRALLVALTGWGQEQHRRRSKEAGFDRHMTKPADAETLRSVLRRPAVREGLAP